MRKLGFLAVFLIEFFLLIGVRVPVQAVAGNVSVEETFVESVQDGDGSESNPFSIATPEEFALFWNLVRRNSEDYAITQQYSLAYLSVSHYKITKDLYFTNAAFDSTFSCLTLKDSISKHSMIGHGPLTSNNCVIKDCTNNATIKGSNAGVVANIRNGEIRNCTNNGTVQVEL